MKSIPAGAARKNAALIIAAFLSLLVAGCAQVSEAAPANDPAAIATVPGSDLHRITLTEHAVQRLGLATVQVATDPQTGKLTVSYAAILYDSTGKTWVYTNPEPLVYVRAPITVDRINADIAQLGDGPPPGTTVVTTGAAELFGAEFDTAQ